MLNFWERFYISEYKANQKEYGYNINIGGGSNVGYHHSEETKQMLRNMQLDHNNTNYGKRASDKTRLKMSEAHKNFHHSEETKQKLSENRKGVRNPMYGRKLTSETINKISGENNHRYGKHLSEETRKKISEHNKGKNVREETKLRIKESWKTRDRKTCNTASMHAYATWVLPDGTEREMKICHVKRFHKDWIMKENIINNNMSMWAYEQPHREEVI